MMREVRPLASWHHADMDAETTTGRSKPGARHRIEIKVSEAQKDLISRAAAARSQGISEFVRSCAEKAAAEILKGK